VKVLNVIGSVDPRGGGTTEHVFSISRVWRQLGHECHILCLDPPQAACVAKSPFTTFALGGKQRRYVNSHRVPLLRYGFRPELIKWLKSNAASYDAVILNGLWNYTSFGSWLVLRKMNTVAYYVCPHGMLDPWLEKAKPWKHLFRRVFWKLIERRVLRDARGVFFACEEERRLAHRAFFWEGGRDYILGYGASEMSGEKACQIAAFSRRFPATDNRKLILFLGRIHPKKGLDLLIRAFSRLADEWSEYDLVVAGPDEDDLSPRLQKLAADLSVKHRIHWTGMLNGDEKAGAFRCARFFVLPSHQENLGIAVLEALAFGVPVLISKKVNIWREVETYGAGYAVENDVEGIVDGLKYMCNLRDAKYLRMATGARTCFTDRFDIEKNAVELANILVHNLRLDKSGLPSV
jgi:glycosyltransferase involved in cell wall biosynthesis